MNKKYLKAKKKVKSLRKFYLHLFIFLIVNMTLLFKLILLEKDESLDTFVWLVLNIMITWSIGIIIHAWRVFASDQLCSKPALACMSLFQFCHGGRAGSTQAGMADRQGPSGIVSGRSVADGFGSAACANVVMLLLL